METLHHAAKTDIGLVRTNNEDYHICRPDLGLWIVCDGMGGHEGGELASRVAAETIVGKIEQGIELKPAIQAAHAAVRAAWARLGQQDAREPGTTVVALKIDNNEWQTAWVGDSRAWLWNGISLIQLTKDHSTVQKLVDRGIISQEDAPHHPESGRLTQAVGIGEEDIRPDSNQGKYQPQRDSFLLASDGLAFFDQPELLAQALGTFAGPEEAVDGLMAASLNAGGRDNITAVVVGWPGRLRRSLGRILPGRLTKLFAVFSFLVALCLHSFLIPEGAFATETLPNPEKLRAMGQEAVAGLLERIGSLDAQVVEMGLFVPKGKKRGALDFQDRESSMEVVNVIYEAINRQDNSFSVPAPAWNSLYPTRVVVLPYYKDNGSDHSRGSIPEVSYRRAMGFLKNQFVRRGLEVIDPYAAESGSLTDELSATDFADDKRLSSTTCKKYRVDLVYQLRLDLVVRRLDNGRCQASARLDGIGYDNGGRDLGMGISKSFLVKEDNCDKARGEVEKEVGYEVGRKLDLTRYFGKYKEGQLDGASAKGQRSGSGDWLLKGEYWHEDDGLFYIKAVLKNIETGREFIAEPVSNGWLSSHRTTLTQTLWGLLALLGAVGFGFCFFRFGMLRNKAGVESALRDGVARRDIAAVAALLANPENHVIDKKLLASARGLTKPVRGIMIEGAMTGRVFIGPGPEQGLGRGDKWLFRLEDPWVSRAPQAWIRGDGSDFILVQNPQAVNQARITGEIFTTTRLSHGDIIEFGQASSFEVIRPTNKWLGVKVINGPNRGDRFVMVTGAADIGIGSDKAVRLGEEQDFTADIFWRKGRPMLKVPAGQDWPLADFTPPDSSSEADPEAILVDSDILRFNHRELRITMVY